jgi:glutamyl/glutaminyl-tRNA synthetase
VRGFRRDRGGSPQKRPTLYRDFDTALPTTVNLTGNEVGRLFSPHGYRVRADSAPKYDTHVPVRVRFAPSPTGFLHIGGVRTALFNWLFARHEGGELLLRIENTDTSREVEESVEQIQRSLRWLGLDWDGPVELQLDSLPRHEAAARLLLAEGHAYEDDGAIRFRMPDEGTTEWEDAIKGRISYANEKLEDLVLLRSDGRPTYNLAAAVDDADSGITHVIRGEDHVPNTPKQIRILEALGREVPVYAHVPNVFGTDGRKLSKRHGAVSVEEFRAQGYLPAALMNYIALLGWSYDDRTTVMSRDELVERFSLDRIGSSPATFDYAKLDWLNGVYLRELAPARFADALVAYLREQGFASDEETIRASAPLVQEKISRLDAYPGFAGFFFRRVAPPAELLDGAAPVLTEARETLAGVEPFAAEPIETALRALAERLGLKPRDAFGPIRAAVTGSRVSPGLFESLELLGRDESLARLDRYSP